MMHAFAHLNREQLKTLWKYLSYKRFRSGVRLFEQGDDPENFYVIWSGQVSARVENTVLPTSSTRKTSDFVKRESLKVGLTNEVIVNVMNVGETLGEASLQGVPRTATCVTEKPTELLVLDNAGFKKTFTVFFEKQEQDKIRFLRQFKFFSKEFWSDNELLQAARFCRECSYRSGEEIVVQGNDANHMFFIVSGLANVEREVVDETSSGGRAVDDASTCLCNVTITKLASGEHFGEVIVLDDTTFNPVYPSSVVCETMVKCLKLERNQMDLKKFRSEPVKAALTECSYKYPDDNFLLQTHLDLSRNRSETKKVMKQLEKTLKKRGRKDLYVK